MDFATYQNLINQNRHRQDNSLSVRFYDKLIKTDKLNDNGIPMFKSVCYCEIRIKDNTTEVFDQPATQDKIERFPIEYSRYQMIKEKNVDGTPLEMFAFLSASEIETCKYRGIFTVESLADLTKDQAQNLQLLNEYETAQKFVSFSKNMVDTDKLKQKIKELEERVKKLSQTNTRRKSK